MVGEVRHPARDPPLRRPRRRALRPAARHPVRHPRGAGDVGRDASPVDACRPTSGDEVSLPPLRDGDRLPVAAEGARHRRASTASPATSYFTSRWPHDGVDLTGKRVAVIGTGLVGHPVDPDHRRAGRAADRVPAHAELQRPRPQRRHRPRRSPTSSAATADVPRGGPLVARRRPATGPGRDALRGRRRTSGRPGTRRRGRRASWSASSAATPTSCSTRRPTTPPRSSSAARSARSSTTPRRPRCCARRTTRSPRSGRASTPATTPRSTCPTSASSTCRRTPIRTFTETGIDTATSPSSSTSIVFATGFDAMTGAIVARRHPRPRRLDAAGEVGARPADLPRPDGGGLPEPVPGHRAGQPSVLSNMMVSIEQHVDWISDCLDHLRADGARRDRADGRGRGRLGRSTSTRSATSRCTRRRTPGTWAPTCRASPASSCPTSAGCGGTARICDEVAADGYRGFEITPARPASVEHQPAGGEQVSAARP